ncbi:MAG: hypothetical protein JSS72_11325 [Armatimonadetes bacterium]|nr:hypothetical protein [Armatimonadota bacterium]
MRRTALVVAGSAVLASFAVGEAQSPEPTLVHLDTPYIQAKDLTDIRLDFRRFSGDEDLTYTSLSLRYGLGHGAEGILRGSFAPRRTFGAVEHGGDDVELAIKYRPAQKGSPYAVMLGIAKPSTATQSDVVPTAGFMASMSSESVTAYFNPRAVLLKDNTLVGIGVGASARLDKNFVIMGDYTFMAAGKNTRDTTTGEERQRPIYGVALRYTSKAKCDASIDFGFANGTSTTTGFGLTPALNDFKAIFIGVAVRL